MITFTKQLPDTHKIVRDRMDILKKSDRMRRVFADPPLVAYRRDRNLRDILVHGKLNRIMREKNRKEFDRRKTNCRVCTILEESKGRLIEQQCPQIELKANMNNCLTWNAVYGILCKTCGKIMYFGETSRSVGERLKGHLADIKYNRQTAVAAHFNEDSHSDTDVGFVILECVRDKSKYYRQICELQRIQKMDTEMPKGLNKKADLGVLSWSRY